MLSVPVAGAGTPRKESGMDPVVSAAVADAHRREWGFVLAGAPRLTGDLDEAQGWPDAFTHALPPGPTPVSRPSPGRG